MPPPAPQPTTDNAVYSTTSMMTTSNLFQIATIAPTSTSALLAEITSTVLSANMSSSTEISTYEGGEDLGQCQLLGPFALFIQAALGTIALMSLVFKRWREKPRRPLKVFLFDASKQVVGTALLHVVNLVMSIFPNDKNGSSNAIISAVASVKTAIDTTTAYKPNPCSWYLLNLFVDTTIGIPILLGFLHLFHAAFRLTALARPPESIDSGNYGPPPNYKYKWWMKQCLIYFLALMCMKFCVFVLFQLLPWLVRVGDWALGWTEGNEALQIAFSMMIFPLCMNAVQYYLIDGLIKKNVTDEQLKADADTRDSDEHDENTGLLAGRENDDDSEDHGDLIEDKTTTTKDGVTSTVTTKAKKESNHGGGAGSSSSVDNSPTQTSEQEVEVDRTEQSSDDSRGHREDQDLLQKVPNPPITE